MDARSIDKQALLESLREQVARDLGALIRGQKETRRAAVHEESRAEHAKDTRATEQSYLARGLAERVAEMQHVADQLARLELRHFDRSEPIALTALVELRDLEDDSTELWWLVPGAGGLRLSSGEGSVRTVTPGAPLGRALLGQRVGDEVELASPSGRRALEVLATR